MSPEKDHISRRSRSNGLANTRAPVRDSAGSLSDPLRSLPVPRNLGTCSQVLFVTGSVPGPGDVFRVRVRRVPRLCRPQSVLL